MSSLEPNFLDKLNTEQKQAVIHPGGPLLIVAGAGTGKTTVITSRVAWLIEQKLAKPEEILAITFTDKAAQEMRSRVDQLLPFGYLDLWISTFHALGQRILERHALDIGLTNDFKLLTPTESWLLVRRHLDKFNLDYYRPLGNPAKFIHALIRHFSRCKDENISPKDYLQYAENLNLNDDGAVGGEGRRSAEVANAFHVYNQLLLDNNVLDFGDLINYTLRLFQHRPKILDQYRRQFKYLLVDEFQDTNLAQYELIRLLAGAPETANLTVVGDHQQAIYKFRGASLSNILHFQRDWPAAAKVFLIKNYRSTQKILDLAQQFIQLNTSQILAKTDFDQAKLEGRLESVGTGEGQIQLISAQTAEGEARAVAQKIIELKNSSSVIWNDFAILLRANSQADIFISALEEAGVPQEFLASSGLYRTPLVLDILAYLRLLDDYHDNTAVYRVCHLAPWRLPAEDLIKIIHLAKKKAWSLFGVLKQNALLALPSATRQNIDQMLALVGRHAALAQATGVRKMVQLFLEESGYLKSIIALEPSQPLKYNRDILLLNRFIEELTAFETLRPEKNTHHYLKELNYILESGEEGGLAGLANDGPEAVKIMTVHSAKGLEFKYVFIVNLVDLRFPATNRSEPITIPDELVKEVLSEGDVFLEEERRLFYVAMTRAKEGLYFSMAQNYGGSRARKPSRFLYEVGLIEKERILAPEPRQGEARYGTGKNKELSSLNREPRIENKQKLPTTIYQLPTRFSFTQLKAFQTCPYQYKFRHILKIPVSGNARFSFGKTMHSALQKFYQRLIDLNSVSQPDLFGDSPGSAPGPAPARPAFGPSPSGGEGVGHQPSTFGRGEGEGLKAPSLDDLLKFYEESWIDDWFEDAAEKERYREEGRRALKSFYEINQSHWTKPLELEKGFTLPLGEYKLIGQIDRLDELPDGAVEIIDYKTGQSKTEETLAAEDKEQLLIYQIATVDLLQKKPRLLSFYYLNQNKKLSFLGTDEDISKLKDKIIKTIEQIKTSDFRATPSPQICRNCDFRNICEFRA